MSRLKRGIRNASSLAIGNFASYAISFLGFIYIARVLEPENMGIWSTVGAFVSLFKLMLLSGFRKVVIREGCKDVDRMHLLLESIAGLRLVLTLAAILACSLIALLMPYTTQVKAFIVLYSLTLIPSGLEIFPGAIYEATEKMHWSAVFIIAERIAFVTCAVTFLYLGFGLKALLVISIISHSVKVLTSLLWSRRLVAFKMLSRVQVDPAVLRPTLIFSLLTFLGYLTIRIDLLMISLLGTSEEVGFYAVAAKIAQQGIMLRNVTATAFFPIAVKAFHKHAVNGARLMRYSAMFFAITFVGSIVVSLVARDLIPLLVGGEYAMSGEILAVLIFFVGVSWIQLPFTTALQATHNEKYSFWPMLITALLNPPLNYFLYRQFGVIGIAYATIIVASIGSLAFCVLGSVVLTRQGHLTIRRPTQASPVS